MTRPLRIAFCVGQFPVVSETFILRQICGLIDLGHAVQIFSDLRGETGEAVHKEVLEYRLQERTLWMDMPLEAAPYEMPVWPPTGKTWVPGSPHAVWNGRRLWRAGPAVLRGFCSAPRLSMQLLRPSCYSYRATSLSGIYRLSRLLAHRGSYDVIHAHFGPVANSYRFARALWQAPLVASFHGYDYCTVPRKEGPDVYRALFETADAVTVGSGYARDQLRRLGCPDERVSILPAGLDLADFPFCARTLRRDETPRLLSVGRLTAIKGHEYLIRAVGLLCRGACPVKLTLVGDGPLRGHLEDLVRELGLDEVVRLSGALPGSEVRALMEQSHLFILPSIAVEGDAEGQGLALQEAQASGLPVIATDRGGVPEGLRPDRSGRLVPERDPDALAACIAGLVNESDQWPEMGEAGRQFVADRYDIDALNLRLVSLYAEAREAYRLRTGRGGRQDRG